MIILIYRLCSTITQCNKQQWSFNVLTAFYLVWNPQWIEALIRECWLECYVCQYSVYSRLWEILNEGNNEGGTIHPTTDSSGYIYNWDVYGFMAIIRPQGSYYTQECLAQKCSHIYNIILINSYKRPGSKRWLARRAPLSLGRFPLSGLPAHIPRAHHDSTPLTRRDLHGRTDQWQCVGIMPPCRRQRSTIFLSLWWITKVRTFVL